MNIFREFFYRPKRSDRGLMARFYYADLDLNTVASELDSFDGRKDPERCSCLVNKLRSCQDKLLHIINKMQEKIEPGAAIRQRQFREKFPDDILTDSLAGQLWFGAECLAAGSSIMNKERESDAMRPLAKAVVKSLDKVRALLREQCLSPQHEYSEKIRENLKIFDRLFAEFEFAYVQCMVHVKSEKEYMLHQDLIVLFSETLQRALRNEMVNQDSIDFFEPSLMFAIPRLAIVNGLLISPTGPLNVDRSSSDFPDLFLPFKNLLKKIRELLLTLAAHEVLVLEMLLCQAEEPANITVKLKEVERLLETRAKSAEGQEQAERLSEKLNNSLAICDTGSGSAESSTHTHEEGSQIVASILESVLQSVVEPPKVEQQEEDEEVFKPAKEIPDEIVIAKEAESPSTRERVSATPTREVEIDCTGPEIRVSPRKRIYSSRDQQQQQPQPTASSSTPTTTSSTYSPRPKQRLRRHNAKRDSKRIPLRYQKDRRAKFKSTEDLLHRLYVCISGAADQLQSNYAGDFRAILKNVFVMNTSQDDEEEEDDGKPIEGAVGGGVGAAGDAGMMLAYSEGATPSPLHSSTPPADEGDGAPPPTRPPPTSQSLPNEMFAHDVATDALRAEVSNFLIQDQLRSCSSNDDIEAAETSSSSPATTAADAAGQAYAANLGMVQAMDSDGDGLESSIVRPVQQEVFYQPEPRLLDIASGDSNEAREGMTSVSSVPEDELSGGLMSPPPWVPDEDAPNCMGCSVPFTLFRRRHHCRSCGQVFCNRCSSHSLALPQYGIDVPVRVCNRCHIIYQYPDIMARQAQQQQQGLVSPAQSPAPSGTPTGQPTGRSPWARNFGMVS